MDRYPNEPVKPGHIKLIKLARDGELQPGDTVETSSLGKCTVAYVRSVNSICVKRADGSYHTLPDICFPQPASLRTSTCARNNFRGA